jgi:hypothetical protein
MVSLSSYSLAKSKAYSKYFILLLARLSGIQEFSQLGYLYLPDFQKFQNFQFSNSFDKFKV